MYILNNLRKKLIDLALERLRTININEKIEYHDVRGFVIERYEKEMGVEFEHFETDALDDVFDTLASLEYAKFYTGMDEEEYVGTDKWYIQILKTINELPIEQILKRCHKSRFEYDLFLTTSELFEFLKKHSRPNEIFTIECNLTSGCLNATHYISYVDDKTLIDCGIDDEEYECSHTDFLKSYPETRWRIPIDTLSELAIA